MNNMLELKGKRFVQAAKKPGSNGSSMNSKALVTTEQLLRLKAKLQQIKEFWCNQTYIPTEKDIQEIDKIEQEYLNLDFIHSR